MLMAVEYSRRADDFAGGVAAREEWWLQGTGAGRRVQMQRQQVRQDMVVVTEWSGGKCRSWSSSVFCRRQHGRLEAGAAAAAGARRPENGGERTSSDASSTAQGACRHSPSAWRGGKQAQDRRCHQGSYPSIWECTREVSAAMRHAACSIRRGRVLDCDAM